MKVLKSQEHSRSFIENKSNCTSRNGEGNNTRIDTIILKNYRQFRSESITFDYDTKAGYDLHLIIGANGSGKTNILNAINWCLYGDEPVKDIIKAAEKGKLQAVNELIAKGADINVSNDDGWTPLMAAVKNGRLDVTQQLIYKGANINSCKRDGWTALMSAAQKGRLEEARLLIDSGADINAQTQDGWTALMEAVDEGRLDIARGYYDL